MLAIALVLVISAAASANDITGNVFGNISHGVSPAAFGDFNSDKLTDIFVIRDDAHAIEVLLANAKEPIMQSSNLTCYFTKGSITSVVPGDFDGDAVMDILVTTLETGKNKNTSVFILWGAQDSVECPTDESHPVISTKDQPLVLDVNQDMISDLFGMTSEGKRMYWVFGPNRTAPREQPMKYEGRDELRFPHSHAFVDIDGDFVTDLVLTTQKGFEVWNGAEHGDFSFNRSFNYPEGVKDDSVGQNLFLDVALNSHLELVLPVCFNDRCENSTIFIYDGVMWRDLRPNFKDPQGNTWGFVKPDGRKFTDVITPRGGDFNLDGYPDLLVTLTFQSAIRTVLLENIHGPNGRTFSVQWTLLGANNNTVAGAFFDFYQKGIMDVLLVQRITHDKQDTSALIAFKNGLDYDANFLKVMVLTGRGDASTLPYGTNLPGPRVSYFTVTQDGSERFGCAAQLAQSAHFALQLPYSIFGLGRTPNFVDKMTTGYAGKTRDWLLVIPNSQMVIVLRDEPPHWRMQLFVTPSRTILETMAVLLGTCVLNVLIIGGLHLKEKREDRLEKLQEAHRFHFDAM